MALYSKEIKRAQDKAKSGKSTKIITKKAEKSPKLKSTYEIAQTVKKPKKKVVKKKETVTKLDQVGADNVKKAIVRSTRTTTKKPFGLGPDDKAYGALPKKKRTAQPFGPGAKDLEGAAKVRAIRKPTVDVTTLKPKKRTAQPFGPGAKDVEQAGRTRRGEPKVTIQTLHDSRLSEAIERTIQAEKAAEAARLKRERDDLFVEKTGGKLSRKKGGTVSRKKGGTVSRNTGGKVFNGNDEVSKYYDM